MAAIGAIPHDALTSFTVLGELGLDGSIAAVAGVLPAAISANGRRHGLICPYACGCEAAWASPEIEIVAAARIFLDFEQADDSATRKFSGTGLGLAISKRIIARMEGRIAVTSKETAGSTFTVSVPLPAAPDSPQDSFTPPHLGDASVMIVATAESEASLLARRLGRWGARTCAVTQKNIAFALLPERAWDTLVVDYPIASAFVAGGQLSKLGVQKRIVLIRPTERHELPALKSAGFTGYLVKPVRAASLAARFGAEDAFEHSTTELAVEAAEALPAAGNRSFHPGRRGQRHQRAPGARPAHPARSSADDCKQWSCRLRILAGCACGRCSVRSGAYGCADAGDGRPRSGPANPCGRSACGRSENLHASAYSERADR